MALLTVRAAAERLGVSYSTLKQWIYKGTVRTVRTGGGHHRVAEAEVDRLLAAEGKLPKRATPKRSSTGVLVAISGRNQLRGIVDEIRVDGLLAQVRLRIGDERLTAVITRDAVEELKLKRGGTALAITEASWSLAFIAGVPLMGMLIARFGWNAPFPLLAGLGLVMFLVIWRMIPRDGHSQPTAASVTNVRAVLTNLPALAGISIALWASAANELVNLIFGVWLEDSFGLKIAALAGASAVIGLSELSGEGLVALTTDRLGKPRALTLGLIGNILASLLLPIVGRTELGALVGLFLFYITFEYVLVSHIPLMTEVMPTARATLLSFNVTGHSLGRMIGALVATFIYRQFGFFPVTLIAVLFNVFALIGLGELTQKMPLLTRFRSWVGRTKRSEA